MFIKILILAIILAVPSQGNFISLRDISECSDYEFRCNPNLDSPCCSEDNYCRRLISTNAYYCLHNALLLEYCKDDADCASLKNSICSNNECVCDTNYMPFNNTKCKALIGGSCDSDGDCALNDAICVNKRCQCKDGYLFLSKESCAPTHWRQTCKTDEDCFDVDRVKCSKDNICTCKENSVMRHNNGVCESLIGGFCNRDSDCSIFNSVCIINKCQCKKMYAAISNYECNLSYLKQDCKNDFDCIDINRATCSEDGKCVCRENHIAFGSNTCMPLIGGYCWQNKECIVYNSICILDRCQCRPETKYSNNNCVREFLDKSCRENEDCEEINYSECFDGKCICKKNHIAIDDMDCASLLDGFCSDNRECVIENSVCAVQKCQCKHGFVKDSKSQCSRAVWNTLCQTDMDCANFGHSECSSNNTCICKENHTTGNELQCATLLGGSCFHAEDCAPSNSDCIESKCRCKDGFVSQSNTQCLLASIGKPCTEDLDCRNTTHAKCGGNKICVCRNNNIAVKNSTCEPLLGSFCWKNEKCAPDNSICVNDECRCKPLFTPLSNNQCVQLPLGKSCTYDTDCTFVSHLECSKHGNCICRPTYKNVNQTECRPYLTGSCLNDNDCIPDNSKCIQRKCMCKDGFPSTDNYKCIPVSLMPKACDTNFDCFNMPHSVCNKFKICECIDMYKNVNGTCISL